MTCYQILLLFSLFQKITYSCESWVLTTDIRRRIQAAEMKLLRRIKGITKINRVRNELVRQELKVEPILKKINKHSSGLII